MKSEPAGGRRTPIAHLDEVLDNLAAQSKSEAELVKLRYFVGMTLEEAGVRPSARAATPDKSGAGSVKCVAPFLLKSRLG